MQSIQVKKAFLQNFEQGLNPRRPEKSAIPAKVLGYGEMSTVLEIKADEAAGLAFKRMPMFRNVEEVTRYEKILDDSLRVLNDEIGVRTPETSATWFEDRSGKLVTIYIAQQKLPIESIGNSLIKALPENEIMILLAKVLEKMHSVFEYNRAHRGEIEIGFDGQISNWAVADYDAAAPLEGANIDLVYFDVSSPLLRRAGVEQLDSELFLRSAPSFLRRLIRLLFVDDVINRYYDERKVVIDLLANFYKEQRADLIPDMIERINTFYSERIGAEWRRISIKEVKSYYKEDAMIWRIYLAARKIDRFLHKLAKKNYPYILPDKIKR